MGKGREKGKRSWGVVALEGWGGVRIILIGCKKISRGRLRIAPSPHTHTPSKGLSVVHHFLPLINITFPPQSLNLAISTPLLSCAQITPKQTRTHTLRRDGAELLPVASSLTSRVIKSGLGSLLRRPALFLFSLYLSCPRRRRHRLAQTPLGSFHFSFVAMINKGFFHAG